MSWLRRGSRCGGVRNLLTVPMIPRLAAALKGSVSWQLMVGGRFGAAQRVAVRTAASIEPHREVRVQHLSAYGSLLITAATAAARDGRRAVAGDLLGSAAETAHRVGSDRTDHETPFGPSQVTMQTMNVEAVTENYPAALEAAPRMPVNPALPDCRFRPDAPGDRPDQRFFATGMDVVEHRSMGELVQQPSIARACQGRPLIEYEALCELGDLISLIA